VIRFRPAPTAAAGPFFDLVEVAAKALATVP
jgi:hypothetical protein